MPLLVKKKMIIILINPSLNVLLALGRLPQNTGTLHFAAHLTQLEGKLGNDLGFPVLYFGTHTTELKRKEDGWI